MKKIIKIYIMFSLLMGLGFCFFIVRVFWEMLFRDNYTVLIDVKYINEFWIEFIIFNIMFVFILIGLILYIKTLGDL